MLMKCVIMRDEKLFVVEIIKLVSSHTIRISNKGTNFGS